MNAHPRDWHTCTHCTTSGMPCSACGDRGGYWSDETTEPERLKMDDELHKLGVSLMKLAWDYIQDGKKYSKDTPVQRRIRSDMARNAIAKWRDGKHYAGRYGNG